MRHFRLVMTALVLTVASNTVFADTSIPYDRTGTIAPTSLITATATGQIVGYFTPSFAGYTDFVRLYDVTSGYTSPWVFNNHTTVVGTSYDFGTVTGGDVLVFELLNGVGLILGDPAHSPDGVNHVYAAPFAGGTVPDAGSFIFPAGTYIAIEDLPNGISDFNYRDDSFIFNNITAVTIPDPSVDAPAVPEPSTLVMFGTGILAAAGAMRRRILGR